MGPAYRGFPLAVGTILIFLLLTPAVPRGGETKGPSPSANSARPSVQEGLSLPTTPTPLQTATGTVLRVDTEASLLEVITGVGLALRVLKIRCGEHTDILAAGRGVRLDSLRRGDLVRLSCRPAPEGVLATRVELLPRPGTEGGPP